MLIGPLIKTEFSTVNALSGANQIKKLIETTGDLVVEENMKVIGVISAFDLATRKYNLVIDCISDKPVLSKTQLIPEVLTLMNKVHSDLLLVYEGQEMIGVVHRHDIIDYLCQSMEQHKNLVQGIAHDLKNPLANVLNITYLLGKESDPVENRELIGYAQHACQYANDIVDDLLFSEDQRAETLKKEALDLNEILKMSVDAFKILSLEKQIELELFSYPGTAEIHADAVKLKRAVSNLVSNAIKFTEPNGKITVHLEKRSFDFLITVKDSGIGIPVDLQPYIFTKFTHAKRQGTNGERSTGLGMYITRQIIELHGGTISLESTPGLGTTFYIKLYH
ncbi:ATP-binding protein [Mucilaginibacter sp. UR6-11]|uniref:ATP-binding protein n=1 Tax=Mucilaginibacter sp. UR6-11 TaxID=1435644 RepID=UPI001E3EFD5A|nr:ATP-binding protein [Mucilaginibacter sp. UR6-11]MCC8423490.1 CBS domain-containing protein [Mucilaginibacter sp. UR6-11]